MGINQKQIRKLYHATIADLELSSGHDKIVTFCQDLNKFFSYKSNYDVVPDGISVINTGDGGTSRWVSINDNELPENNVVGSGITNTVSFWSDDNELSYDNDLKWEDKKLKINGEIFSRPDNSVPLFNFVGKNSSGQLTSTVKFGSAQGLNIPGATHYLETGFLINSSVSDRKFFIKATTGTVNLITDSITLQQGDLANGKFLVSDDNGKGSWQNLSIESGLGMDFSNITSTSGTIILGTPSNITNTSINEVSGTTHYHRFDATTFVDQDSGIYVTGENKFKIDPNVVMESTIPGLTTVSGITENTFLGTISSGLTLGMIYIENTGTSTAYLNVGTTTIGNEINPYNDIIVQSGETLSITVNRRLSNTETTQLYVSSNDWTNVELIVQWAEITYKNQSNQIDPSSLPIAAPDRLGGVKIGNNINIDSEGKISIDDPVVSLIELTDTSITNPQINQVLTYNGSNWVNGSPITTLSELSDTSITSPQEEQVLTYSGGTWVNGSAVTTLQQLKDTNIIDLSSGQVLVYNGTEWSNDKQLDTGGFRGTVTQSSTQPTNLKDYDWVQPKPNPDSTYNYTFTNFKDINGLGINVNLSLEDVKLRYVSGDPGYWVKEGFNKPIGDSKTWVGNANNEIEEINVIDEWVSNETALQYIGQKFSYDTQTLFVTDLGPTITTIPNYIFIRDINLNSTSNNTLLTIPSGKKLVINSIKLITNNTISGSFTINIGSNASLYYNNILNGEIYSNVNANDIYDLNIYQTEARKSIVLTSGNLILRVTSTPGVELTSDILIEGFIY